MGESKASMKQEVIIPHNYTALGMQLQYFVGTVEICFRAESIIWLELNRLLLQVGKYKKQSRDLIAFDDWFAARFLYAVDKQVQLFLTKRKIAETRLDVNDLDFSDIVAAVLLKNLPCSFRLPSKVKLIHSRG